MSYFLKSGSTYRAFSGDSLNIGETLPAANFVVQLDPHSGFYLETAKPFTLPDKIYGDCEKNSQRVLNTYAQRCSNTGVLLVGEKGSGKTLLARHICMNSDMPVLLVNSAFTGDAFYSFLSSIDQPCIVFLDEFEKVYKKEDQERMLTLLDGTYQSKKLFLLTSNDQWRIDTNMKNRPGRIFYLIEFGGLEEEFILEYCEDKLDCKEYGQEIVSISKRFEVFNFDLLSSIIEETNRYKSAPLELVGLLNAKPEYCSDISYTVTASIQSIIVPPGAITPREVSINTSNDTFEPDLWFEWDSDNEKSEEIDNVMEQDWPDWDVIVSLLKSGDLRFHTRRNNGKSLSALFGEGKNVKTQSFEVQCEPEDIIRYDNSGGVEYKSEDGVCFVLTRDRTKKKKRPMF